MDEIKKHKKRDDCWLVIEDCVYNVTDYISQHPGGDRILEGAGKDATQLFKKYHMLCDHKKVGRKFYLGALMRTKN